MKHRKLIFTLLAVLCLLGAAFLESPVQIIGSAGTAEIYTVTVWDGDAQREDVTGQVDTAALAEIIDRYSRDRSGYDFSPYQICAGDIEIGFREDGRNWHLLLSSGDGPRVVYESAEKGGYAVRWGQQLFDELTQAIAAARG